MRRDNRGISRIVEFVIMFTVFIVIVTAFYSLANIWLRPPIVDYNQEETMRISEVLIENPGYLKNGSADWEKCNAITLNNNLTSLGFAVDNNSYGVLSMKKIIAMRNLTYEKAKQAMALDYLNFNITFRYFNGSIMLSNKTDNETALTFGVNFGDNATVSWKRVVNIVDLDGKYENATLTIYLSKKGRFDERVVINEIMYRPANGADNTDEWVELYNCANMAVDLEGWYILDNTTDEDTLSKYKIGTIISSNGFAIIVDSDTNVSANFSVDESAIWLIVDDDAITGWGLNNTGENIILRNQFYDAINNVNYKPEWGGDGDGNTTGRVNPLSNTWGQSTDVGGTPGRKNSIS